MDNITHTLAGLVIAEAVVQSRRRRSPLDPGFARAAYWVSAIANNLPDFDFAYVWLTGGKLGYLLHHRGHTHTLVFVPVAACLVLGGVWLWQRRRGKVFSRQGLGWLAVLAVVGPLVHLALDLTNNYGIHPFWPFDNRWLYGDGIFIIEPYLLACGIVGLLFAVRRAWVRATLLILAAAVVAAVWLLGIVPKPAAAIFTVVFALLIFAAQRASPLGRVALSATGWVVITAFFLATGTAARTAFAARLSDAHVLDVVMTPLPATPWCWSAFSVELEGPTYRVVSASVAPLSSLMDATSCLQAGFGNRTAPAARVERDPTPAVAFQGAFVGNVSTLRALARDDCRARAFLRFARAPFWTDRVIGDLRYDRNDELGFAELELDNRSCPVFVPPWHPPRADALAEQPTGGP